MKARLDLCLDGEASPGVGETLRILSPAAVHFSHHRRA